jgi:hypothetical protein
LAAPLLKDLPKHGSLATQTGENKEEKEEEEDWLVGWIL